MANERLAGVELPLSEEQKALIRDIAGVEKSSVFVVVRTDKPRGMLPQETTESNEEELCQLLCETHEALLPTLEKGNHELAFEGVIAAAVVW